MNGYIHSYKDAELIVHSVRLGLFKPTEKRLSKEERDSLSTGSIYCFVESEYGMKRWTDGRIWSPSKVFNEFLVYKEVPKHLSKSSLKKIPKEKRVKTKFSTSRSLEFFKKTISIPFDGKTYHIISYYQPMFDRRSISTFRFFLNIKTAFNRFKEISSDEYIEKIFQKNRERFMKKMGIESMSLRNIIAEIDRSELERLAASVIQFDLKLFR